MEDNFLADVAKEGANDPFDNLVKDTPTESPPDTTAEMDKPAEGANTPEENIPFHKHPRWIEREKELTTLREQREADAKAIAELKEQSSKHQDPSTSVPDWFKELYGDNQAAWQKYDEHEQTKEQEIEKRILDRQKQATQQQAEEAAHWNRWVDGEIKKLEDEGNKFDRNELIKTMLKYRPTDENNNFDFKAGYEIYDTMRAKEDPAKSLARKQLADTTSGSSKGEPARKDYKTASDLRNRSWGNLL